MAGYAARLIHVKFPELSEDPEKDPIWVTIRNPKLMTLDQMQPRTEQLDPEGAPVPGARKAAMNEIIARLVVAWRVYDASKIDVDPMTGQPLDQPLLPLPATPELVAKLPAGIINRLGDEMASAVNPQ